MKIISSSEVPELIKDGDLVLCTGITLGGYAEEAVLQIEKSFLEKGHPRDLTFMWQTGIGDMKDRGLCHVCHEGLMTRGIGSHISGCGVKMMEFCRDNKAEFYNWPQGVCMDMMRAIAAHQPGVITKTGLRTFMDPRLDCGRMNEAARGSLIDLIEIDGQEWLHYKMPHKINVVLIRGTVADEKGNISMYKEAYKLGQVTAASAAKADGGIVICQVEGIVKSGTLHPRRVKVPGMLIDYVYVARPEYHWQTGDTIYNPVFSGEQKAPHRLFPKCPMSARKIIARRAALELRRGDIATLGVGTPQLISAVTAEEGCFDMFTLTTDTGCIGGVPGQKNNFGSAWNAEAIIDSGYIFDIYDGGTLDIGFLGFIEIQADGDLNVSRRNGLGIGVGGFMNISAGASRVIFMGTFTGGITKEGMPEFSVQGGRLNIIREGNKKKFVRRIEQVSFSGREALESNKEVLYVTERAVFRLTAGGLKLIEIAPGVDLQKDILDQMEFMPEIDEDLCLMPAAIFRENWGGLKNMM